MGIPLEQAAVLSVAQCRKLLGAEATGKKDEEIEEIRDALYQFAHILVERQGNGQEASQPEIGHE